MCGIFFTINNDFAEQPKIEGFLRDAFYASQVRGTDGSGMTVIGGKTDEEKKHPFFFKSQNPATMFLENDEVKKGLTRARDAKLALCHVRAATHGDVKGANAHPFRVIREDKSYIIGVHNGTLTNWKSHKESSKFEVDSHWALHMIANHGTEAFEYFQGAWAFVWYDSKTPDKVYMCRNSGRTLNIMVDSTRKMLVGASEAGMLGWLAERNRINVAQNDKKVDEFYYLTTDHLFTVDINSPDRWEIAKLPSYNYLKMFPASSAYKQPVGFVGNRNYNHRYDRHSYDPSWDGYMGRVGANVDYNHSRQESIIKDVKNVLAEARTKRWAKNDGKDPDATVDSDDLENALHEAIAEAYAERDKPADTTRDQIIASAKPNTNIIIPSQMIANTKPYYLRNPLDGTATKGEIKLAREEKVYGQVVQFLPVVYDPEDQALLGDIELIIPNTPHTIKAIGEIRHDITKAKADNLIAGEVPILVAIVGSTDYTWPVIDRKSGGANDVYVLSNLTQAQRESAIRQLYH